MACHLARHTHRRRSGMAASLHRRALRKITPQATAADHSVAFDLPPNVAFIRSCDSRSLRPTARLTALATPLLPTGNGGGVHCRMELAPLANPAAGDATA